MTTVGLEGRAPSRPPGIGSRPDLGALVPWVLACAAVAARLVFLRAAHCTHEDALITLRYAENLAHGVGFVYNPGERVLGTTTPLYTLFLALVDRLGAPAMPAGKLANILADGVSCWLLARLGAALGHPRAGWLASLLYAFSFIPVYFAVGGMETGLVTLAGLAALYWFVVRRQAAMGIALGFLFLLRIDGLALAAALLAGWAWRDRKLPWAALGAGLLVALPWLIAATLYFGSPVPASALAKLVVYNRMRPGLLPNLGAFAHQFWSGAAQKALLLCAAAGTIAAWKQHAVLRPAIAWMLVYYAAMLAAHAPVGAFGWYFAPPMPLYLLLAALGVRLAVGAVLRTAGRPAGYTLPPTAALTCLVLGTGLLSLHLRSGAREAAETQRAVEDELRRPIGLWLRTASAPNEKVMLEPIGYIGYYCQRPVLDIVGLVSPEVLPSYARGVAYPLADIVRRFSPPLLVIRANERASIEAAERATGQPTLSGRYRLLRTFAGADGRPAFWVYRRAVTIGDAQR